MSCGTPGFPAPCPATAIDLTPMQQAAYDAGVSLVAALVAIGGVLILIEVVGMAVAWVKEEVGGFDDGDDDYDSFERKVRGEYQQDIEYHLDGGESISTLPVLADRDDGSIYFYDPITGEKFDTFDEAYEAGRNTPF